MGVGLGLEGGRRGVHFVELVDGGTELLLDVTDAEGEVRKGRLIAEWVKVRAYKTAGFSVACVRECLLKAGQ